MLAECVSIRFDGARTRKRRLHGRGHDHMTETRHREGWSSQMCTREPDSVREHQIGLQGASPAVRQDKRRTLSAGVGIRPSVLALVLILLGSTWTAGQSSAEVYQASVDFSLVQGTRGWSYLDSSGAALTPDATLNRWWQAGSLRLGPTGGHPGATRDAVRRWTAPQDGTAHITGTARDLDSGGGDGVVVLIRHGATELWRATINNGNTTGVAFDLTRTIRQGETLDFVINRRSNHYWDSTYFDPTITLITGPAPDTTPPTISSVTASYVTPSSALISVDDR